MMRRTLEKIILNSGGMMDNESGAMIAMNKSNRINLLSNNSRNSMFDMR